MRTDFGIDENAKLTDCYYEKKDWRACKMEVSEGFLFQARIGNRDVAERESQRNKWLTSSLIVNLTDGGIQRVLEEAWK